MDLQKYYDGLRKLAAHWYERAQAPEHVIDSYRSGRMKCADELLAFIEQHDKREII